MNTPEVILSNGKKSEYAILYKGEDGKLVCAVSGALHARLESRDDKKAVIVEVRQAREFSREREAAALQRTLKDADCCLICQAKIQQHYDAMIDLRAEESYGD